MLLSTLQTIALIVGIAYYLFIMRNSQRNQELARKAQEHALETRQAQLFMNTYLHLATEELTKADYDLFNIDLKNMEDWNKLLEDKDKYTSFNIWLLYFEGVGLLVRKQLIDIDHVARLLSGAIMSFWEKYEAGFKGMREHYEYPRVMIELEFLYHSVLEYGRKHPELEIVSPPLYQSKSES